MSQRVYLEVGQKRTFAVSLDWPGWARSGRHADDALAHLWDYAPRFSAIVGADVGAEDLTVVGTIPGNATTDFGAPRVPGPWDATPSDPRRRDASLGVLGQCWDYFDAVVALAPQSLVRGPRGGGRDRDQIVAHVREAERHFAAKFAPRVAPRTAWSDQRNMIVRALREHHPQGQWPVDFALRIVAWHVVDHAWEIEDKVPSLHANPTKSANSSTTSSNIRE